jgi:outer membrane protein OmpA-like peptidoglycan-associated protein
MVEAGISADRISTKSFGETQPAVANDSAANRKLNRRAVIVTTLKD